MRFSQISGVQTPCWPIRLGISPNFRFKIAFAVATANFCEHVMNSNEFPSPFTFGSLDNRISAEGTRCSSTAQAIRLSMNGTESPTVEPSYPDSNATSIMLACCAEHSSRPASNSHVTSGYTGIFECKLSLGQRFWSQK